MCWRKPRRKKLRRLKALAVLLPLSALAVLEAQAFLGGFFRGLIGLIGGLALALGGGGVFDASKFAENQVWKAKLETVSELTRQLIDTKEELAARLDAVRSRSLERLTHDRTQQQRHFELPELSSPAQQQRLMEQTAPALYGPVQPEQSCQMAAQMSRLAEALQQHLLESGLTPQELSSLVARVESDADANALGGASNLELAAQLTMIRQVRLAQTRALALRLMCQQYLLDKQRSLPSQLVGRP